MTSRRAFAALLGVYAALATARNYVFPIFEAPDEPSHFAYTRLLCRGEGLPNESDPARSAQAEGFNPPLYYLLAAGWLRVLDSTCAAAIDVPNSPAIDAERFAQAREHRTLPAMNPRFVWFPSGDELDWFEHPDRGPFAPGPLAVAHGLRFVSLACGLITLLGCFALARLLLPAAPWAQLAGVAAVAFDPQFVYLSSVLNSDNLVAVFATLLLWRAAAVAEGRRGRAEPFVSGALLGLGVLAKSNMLFLAVPAALAFWSRRTSRASFARDLAGFGSVALVLCGWFFVRNALLYGWGDPLGWETRAQLHPLFVLPAERWHFFSREFLPALFMSYWGVFGWLSIQLPPWQYAIYLALGSWSAGSLAARIRRGPRVAPGARLLLLALLLNAASLFAFNFQFRAHQGRLLFPTIAATAWLVGAAFEQACVRLPARRAWALALAFCAACAALVISALATTYLTVYR
jgi:hypothetical protein